jgi:hypothetical protein
MAQRNNPSTFLDVPGNSVVLDDERNPDNIPGQVVQPPGLQANPQQNANRQLALQLQAEFDAEENGGPGGRIRRRGGKRKSTRRLNKKRKSKSSRKH